MEIQQVAELIATIGFPAFVATWLLYYGNKRQKEMINAIHELKLEIAMNRKLIETFLVKHEGKKE